MYEIIKVDSSKIQYNIGILRIASTESYPEKIGMKSHCCPIFSLLESLGHNLNTGDLKIIQIWLQVWNAALKEPEPEDRPKFWWNYHCQLWIGGPFGSHLWRRECPSKSKMPAWGLPHTPVAVVYSGLSQQYSSQQSSCSCAFPSDLPS